jgi:Tol biopolymer transport system component
MKKQFLSILLLFMGITFVFAQKIVATRQIPINGFFTNPVVSPDGQYALLTGEHYHGVFLLNLSTNELKNISHAEGSGYGYSWNADSSRFYFKQKGLNEYNNDAKVYSFMIENEKITVLENIKNNYLPSFSGLDIKKQSNIVVYTNLATLKIEATDLLTQEKWEVTKDEGQFYNAILSNDGSKVAVHNGSSIYIYDTKGDGRGKNIGTGLVTSWSNDDRYLIGFLDESRDGHSVTNSELYLFDTINNKEIKLTNTENSFEMFPYLYDTNKIIYADDKSGHLFISNIKF